MFCEDALIFFCSFVLYLIADICVHVISLGVSKFRGEKDTSMISTLVETKSNNRSLVGLQELEMLKVSEWLLLDDRKQMTYINARKIVKCLTRTPIVARRCIVCLDQPPDVTHLPCQHQNVCSECHAYLIRQILYSHFSKTEYYDDYPLSPLTIKCLLGISLLYKCHVCRSEIQDDCISQARFLE